MAEIIEKFRNIFTVTVLASSEYVKNRLNMALFVVGDLGGTNCRLELLDTSIPEARWHGTRPTVAKAKYGSATALPA